MAATTVCACFFHRNGDKNYLRTEPRKPVYVSCPGENDIGSLEAAYMAALGEIGITAKQLHDYREKHRPPSHD